MESYLLITPTSPSQTCHAKPKLKSTGAGLPPSFFPLVGCLPQAAWPERLLSEKSGRWVEMQQIKERGALPMIDRGDIRRRAIDRCSNIWASSRVLVMAALSIKGRQPDCKIQRSGRNVVRRLMYEYHRDYLRSGYLHHCSPVMGC